MTSIIVFSYPEMILKTTSINFIKNLLSISKLNLFCLDEVHKFIDFELSFRTQFQVLKSCIIPLFKNNYGSCIIPILMMTATLDCSLFNFKQKMLGICIEPRNIFWGTSNSFKKQHPLKNEILH